MIPLIIIVVYVGLLLCLGAYAHFSFSRKTAGDYFLASRSIGPFLLVMSIFGTTMTEEKRGLGPIWQSLLDPGRADSPKQANCLLRDPGQTGPASVRSHSSAFRSDRPSSELPHSARELGRA